jgi:hypothetical protein
MTVASHKKVDPEANRRKAREWRARMRAQGFRPVQLWVPDTRSAAFREEAARQMALLAASPRAVEDHEWVESVSIDLNDLP